MTYKTTKYAVLLASGLMINTATWADESADWSLSMLVGNCIACHGPEGSSVGPATPTIAEMDEETFVEIMEAYKKDEFPSTIMGRIARGYDKNDFEAMAKYFAKQTFVRHEQISKVDKKKAKKGKKIHKKFCEKCHEDYGFTVDDGATILAGQWMPYLQYTFADYVAGTRDMPKGMKKRWKKMMKRKGEKRIELITYFYATLTDDSPLKPEKSDDDSSSD
ncbi:c-type cytochrome [Candidatus Parabeggiatoa sp. HSG14]|uniref:c-type cytochrome n=1 Tax=Candidatus Parabeggiatoa sp. HSG14 TaxID=3055593 RepID=UPI0025A87B65|nr:cytochrome c4 [Thiotrichales bacterium HSG14]